jgi:DnaJ homolog subfamily C member 7
MKGLFNPKKSSKKQPAGDDTVIPPPSSQPGLNNQHSHGRSSPSQPLPHPQSRSTPPPRSESSSPVKPASLPAKSSAKPSGKKSSRPASPAHLQREQTKSRSSRSFGRHSTDSSRRGKFDPNTHPLNLPPDEIKRLSALSAMSDRNSFDKMDVDKENSAQPPSSPPPAQPQKSFTVPINSPTTNGSKPQPQPQPQSNGEGPAPPPHRSNPSSPVPSDAEQAENYKSLGNKSFKDRQYKKAIREYSQGNCLCITFNPIITLY